MGYKLRVDWIKCEGYGLCGDYASGLIELDDWRYPILDPKAVPDSRLHEAARAVDCCPMKALTLIREEELAGRERARGRSPA